MKKIFFTTAAQLCLLFTCLGQINQGNFGVGHGKKILVAFFIDGKQVKIRNHFKLIFVNEKDTFPTAIKGIQAIPQNIEKDTGYRVIFLYKKYVLSFDRITKRMISADQDITWDFGTDNYPFHQNLDILTSENYKSAIEKKVKQIQYLRFDLMEYGDGIQFVKKID
jgi:hypothetical protein